MTSFQEAAQVLKEEANVLAIWMEGTTDPRPHRVDDAIKREIKRLREIAAAIHEDSSR